MCVCVCVCVFVRQHNDRKTEVLTETENREHEHGLELSIARRVRLAGSPKQKIEYRCVVCVCEQKGDEEGRERKNPMGTVGDERGTGTFGEENIGTIGIDRYGTYGDGRR